MKLTTTMKTLSFFALLLTGSQAKSQDVNERITLLEQHVNEQQILIERLQNALVMLRNSANDTYLKKNDAESTYLKKNDAGSTYLKKSDAGSTYLKKSDAGKTYLKKSDAGKTYLKKSDAVRTYLSKANAASTYLDAGDCVFRFGHNDKDRVFARKWENLDSRDWDLSNDNWYSDTSVDYIQLDGTVNGDDKLYFDLECNPNGVSENMQIKN